MNKAEERAHIENWSREYGRMRADVRLRAEIDRVQAEVDKLTVYLNRLQNVGPGDDIKVLRLTNRTYNALKRAGLDNIPMLMNAYETGALKKMRGFGKGMIDELKQVLLRLNPTIDPLPFDDDLMPPEDEPSAQPPENGA